MNTCSSLPQMTLGMVTSLPICEPKNSLPISLVMINDVFEIKPLTTSSLVMILIVVVSTLSSVIVSFILKMRKFSKLAMVVLVVITSMKWPLPRRSCASIIFFLLPLVIAFRYSNTILISNYMPLRYELQLLPSILSSTISPCVYYCGHRIFHQMG